MKNRVQLEAVIETDESEEMLSIFSDRKKSGVTTSTNHTVNVIPSS